MMKQAELDAMGYRDLLEMQAKLSQAIARRKEVERADLKRELAALAAKSGFSIDELMGKGKPERKTVAPKYRHPKNAELTWTGRGRKPRWLNAELEAGKKMDSFLIK